MWVLHGSVVKCITCNLEAPGSSCTGSSGFCGTVLGQDISETQPSTGETQEITCMCELLQLSDK